MDHPYVPRDLQLTGYVPCVFSQSDILIPFIGISLLIVTLVWLLSGCAPKISKIDRMLMCWWAFTGLTHIILEGYFAFSPDFYKNKPPTFLDDLWKEYSKGDSRYVGRDAAVVTVEAITAAIEGPACLLIVYAIGTRKPYSYILQLVVSLGQLYGCAVYFGTAYLMGDNFTTSPYYYWAYYIGANSSWIVIPSLIAARSWKKLVVLQKEKGKTL
nr:sterol 8,7 isomerase [Paris polyphylla]